jgi:diketogulonate reductase-like aldo/keto reductase
MHITIRNTELKPTSNGNDLIIKQFGLYDVQGKFVRNCKINQDLVQALKAGKLLIKTATIYLCVSENNAAIVGCFLDQDKARQFCQQSDIIKVKPLQMEI